MDSRFDKEEVVHIYKGILLGYKKEWNFTFGNNIDGPGGNYAK